MKKMLSCMLVAMLLLAAHMTVALAAGSPGKLRDDMLTYEQLNDGEGTVLGSDILRSDIASVEFLDSLDGAPGDAWDVSAAGDGSVMAWVSDGALTIAADGGVRAPDNALLLFANYSNATSIRFNGNFDTSETQVMVGMFYNCYAVESLDVEGFNTSAVTAMSYMFNQCLALKSLDVSGFDTARVEEMSTMFQRCTSLEALDVSGFDTSSVTNMDYMFNNASKIKLLDVSGFDTRKATTLKHMFYGCSALENIYMGQDFVIGSGVDTEDMFGNTTPTITLDGATMTPEAWMNGEASAPAAADRSDWPLMREDALTTDQLSEGEGTVLGSDIPRADITSIAFSGSLEGAPSDAWDVSDAGDGSVMAWVSDGALTVAGSGGVRAPENARGLFANYTNVAGIRFNGCFDTSKTTNMLAMFYSSSALEELDLTGMDTSAATNMAFMFDGLEKLKALDVSGFDTGRVENMSTIFQNCASLETLDVSGFNTSNVTAMDYMFNKCSGLKSVDVSGFDTASVTSMDYMFNKCGSLESVDVSGFNTANVKNMAYLFNECGSLESVDVSGFNTANATDMSAMFSECYKLEALDVSGFDTANATSMAFMFDRCENLKSLDVSGFDTANVADMNTMFQLCSSLEALDVSGFNTSNVTAMDYMFNNCHALKSVDVSGFDTGKVTTLKHMFYGTESMEEIRMGEAFVVPEGADTEDMFTKSTATIALGSSTMTPRQWLDGDYGDQEGNTVESGGDDEPQPQPEPPSEWFRIRRDTLTVDELSEGTGTVLGSDIPRSDITSVEFLDSLDGAPGDAWDVSEAGDGSVKAWVSDGALTIAANGGVQAPEDAMGMFANYSNCTSIRFNRRFNTTGTKDMFGMFSKCAAL